MGEGGGRVVKRERNKLHTHRMMMTIPIGPAIVPPPPLPFLLGLEVGLLLLFTSLPVTSIF